MIVELRIAEFTWLGPEALRDDLSGVLELVLKPLCVSLPVEFLVTLEHVPRISNLKNFAIR